MLVDPYPELSIAFCFAIAADHTLIEQTNKRELAARAVFP
jgi:hypothetical protein